MSKISQEDI